MAEVWYAENQIEKPAAVKILNEDLSHNAQIVERFRNEAKITVKLNHPNIRQVYDYDEIDGRPCMVMEYLEGADLSSRMKNGERFTDEQLKKWWNQLASALNYTHAQGVVHRDIKPSNIFVTHEGDVKLLDFGIAKVQEGITMTQTGATMGTLMYMSPEQVMDAKHIDAKTDLYSLAVSFVHLHTGKAPYDTTTTNDYEIRKSIVEFPLELGDIPAEWQNFLRPYLAKNPKDRPALTEFSAETSPSGIVPPVAPVAHASDETVVDGDATVDGTRVAEEGTVAEMPQATVNKKSNSGPASQKPKKKRKGLIIGIIVVLLLGGGVTLWMSGIGMFYRGCHGPIAYNIRYGTMTDQDNNTYKTIEIGDQEWMAENMRAVNDREGHPRKYIKCPDGQDKQYGFLYGRDVALDICPQGWRLPSDEDWNQLENYVSGLSDYVCGWNPKNIAKALASTEGWVSSNENCDIGCDRESNNATGFSALPVGCYNGGYAFTWKSAYFWSTTGYRYLDYYGKIISDCSPHIGHPTYNNSDSLYNLSFSVRCVRSIK
ncbi:MAG: protein kinase [Bacteroidales bacterium]|nr:protein kinase [Bacteroidales bacterium]